MRTRHIGIIGVGIAGLHLGLRLQRLGIACTIITDKTPEQVAAAQLANMVVHWPTTLGRERVLGVYHWPAEEYGFSLLHNRIQTPEPIDIHCHATQPARAVDYRIYLPRLMEDFAERGGRLQVRQIDATNIGCIAERFDLIVVATPANGFQYLFARDDANSPYDRPQRHYVAGLYHGFRPAHARRATLSIAPGHGEAVCFPFLSRHRNGHRTGHHDASARRAGNAARVVEQARAAGFLHDVAAGAGTAPPQHLRPDRHAALRPAGRQ